MPIRSRETNPNDGQGSGQAGAPLDLGHQHQPAEIQPDATLEKPAFDRNAYRERRAALEKAQTISTHPDELLVLASHPDGDVRAYVACNIMTPEAALLILAKTDSRPFVQEQLAHWRKTPAEALEIIAKSPDPDVRWSVAKNPNTPLSVLLRYIGDENEHPAIRTSANNHKTLHDHVDLVFPHAARHAAADDPKSPVELLEVLANDHEARIRRQVAKNPSTPVEILVELSKDPETWVRLAVIYNPNTPPEVLKRLAWDNAYEVRSEAMACPRTPPADPPLGYPAIDAYIKDLKARMPGWSVSSGYIGNIWRGQFPGDDRSWRVWVRPAEIDTAWQSPDCFHIGYADSPQLNVTAFEAWLEGRIRYYGGVEQPRARYLNPNRTEAYSARTPWP